KQVRLVLALFELECLSPSGGRVEALRLFFEFLHRRDQRLEGLLGEPGPGRLWLIQGNHGFGGPAPGVGDDWRATSVRLGGADPEVLLAREQERPTAAEVVAQDLIFLPAEEFDCRPGQGFQPIGVLSTANDNQSPAEAVARLYRQVDPLVRGECG